MLALDQLNRVCSSLVSHAIASARCRTRIGRICRYQAVVYEDVARGQALCVLSSSAESHLNNERK